MTMYKWKMKVDHVQVHTHENREDEMDELLPYIQRHLFFLALQPVENLLKYYIEIEDTGYHGERYNPKTGEWESMTREDVLEDENTYNRSSASTAKEVE